MYGQNRQMGRERLPTLSLDTLVVAILMILDPSDLLLTMWERDRSMALIQSLASFVKGRIQSLHFHSKLFIVVDSTKSLNSCALGLLVLSKRLNGFQPSCLGWRELLLRCSLAWRGSRDPWKLLTSQLGGYLWASSAAVTWRFRKQEGRSFGQQEALRRHRLLVVQPVCTASFLLLPSYVCKPVLATTNIFYQNSFEGFMCFPSSVSPDLRI